MTGAVSQYLWLQVAQMTFMAMTTTSIVYSRLIAEEFTLTRGFSLALAGSTPAAVAALGAPFLTGFIDAHGWRAGYFALAAWSLLAGSTAFLLIPKGGHRARPRVSAVGRSMQEYRTIVKSRAFIIILVGMALCNLPFIVQSSQMGVILRERGLSSEAVGFLVSLFAFGVIGGRIVCGLCLDRFPTHIVVATAMALPAVGFFILASGITVTFLIAVAVALIGLSMGADMDIMPFVVMRYFRVEIFSTVIGLIGSAVASSAAIGSLLLSASLKLNGGDFTAFLVLCTFTAFTGGLSFLLLGRAGIRGTKT
jgi:predicted MFS family arabinose efflux permease